MNPRERILTALRREEPDRVPLGIHFAAAKYEEFMARTGKTDPAEYFELDYRHVPVKPSQKLPDFSRYFEGRVPDWPDMNATDFSLKPFRGNRAYFIMGDHNTAMNEWGEYRIYGDDRDYHKKVCPLDHADCTVAEIEAYPFPDLTESYRYEGVAEAIRHVHERHLTAILSWEMTIFEKAWRIRGLEEMMMDFIVNPELVEALVEQVATRTGYLATRYAEMGVDIIQFGDDIGSQTGMMINPKHWRKHIKPRMAKIIADVKSANPDVLVFYHTDGIVNPVIPELIEIGIDILNPVQPECMDIADLKRQYGDQLSFWGAIGVQSIMPFGSPEDVRTAVERLIDVAGHGGGLLVAPAHVIEHDVPWENVEAFVNAVREFGKYTEY